MTEWWTYRPSDFLMFAPRTYWRLFELHNEAWWPAQALLLLAGSAALAWLARERGIAVIANRPFRQGDLLDGLKRHPLPAWAAEIDCDSWAQVALKFVVSHPAVTCAIPATSQIAHVRQNMGAARGRLPAAALRLRMATEVAAL